MFEPCCLYLIFYFSIFTEIQPSKVRMHNNNKKYKLTKHLAKRGYKETHVWYFCGRLGTICSSLIAFPCL